MIGAKNLNWLFSCVCVCVRQGYSVDEKSEVKIIKQTMQYHKAQNPHFLCHASTSPALQQVFSSCSSIFVLFCVPCFNSPAVARCQIDILRSRGFNIRSEHDADIVTGSLWQQV